MKWYEIAIACVTAVGGFEFFKFVCNLIFNRKNNNRINDTVATNAEVEAEKNKAIAQVEVKNAEIEVEKHKAVAEAEAKKALEEAHAVERKQNEERFTDLHAIVDRLNGQLDYYVKRDAEKEKRFDEQTAKLREVQKKLLEETQLDIEYEKRIAELELKIEKIKCYRKKCPFRQPPTADTPVPDGRDLIEYFKDIEDGN